MIINLKQLKNRCNAKISSFWGLGQEYTTTDGSYTYIDRGGSVLAVAHLDTVNDYDHFYHLVLGKEHLVYSTALDDRLGAYIILDMLPKLIGTDFDVLLTEGEEVGRSTAFHFEPSHDYNWMFQFDRHGDDVVMYQYETPDYLKMLKDYKFRCYPGAGSFSDISTMDHLNCAGFNFACGYEDNHSIRSHCDIDVVESQVRKFVKFYKDNKDTYLPAPPKPARNYQSWRSQLYDWDKDYAYNSTSGTYSSKKYLADGLNTFESYDVGDCVNCGCFNVDTDEDGLCEDCAKKYLNATTNIKNSWNKCESCGNWSDKLDEYGICPPCYDYYEATLKE